MVVRPKAAFFMSAERKQSDRHSPYRVAAAKMFRTRRAFCDNGGRCLDTPRDFVHFKGITMSAIELRSYPITLVACNSHCALCRHIVHTVLVFGLPFVRRIYTGSYRASRRG